MASEGQDSDYFDIVLAQTKGKVFRFKAMPVAVFLEKCDSDEASACKQAFALWREATDALIQFRSVPSAKSARVIIKFVNLPQLEKTTDSNTSDGGHTLMEWHSRAALLRVLGRSKVFVPPQIVEINLSALDARPATLRAILLQNIVAHELGHAIGLLAHSTESGDLMYTKTDENSKLSARDLNTVRKLYKLKPDVLL